MPDDKKELEHAYRLIWKEMSVKTLQDGIKSKMDADRADNKLKVTPLHCAVRWADSTRLVRKVKLLLGVDADVNLEDIDGRTPLDYAMERKEKLPHESNELNKVIELLEKANNHA